jgi:hypothetical protein
LHQNVQIRDQLVVDLTTELDHQQRILKSVPSTVTELLGIHDRTLADLNERSSAIIEQQQTSSKLDATQAHADRLLQALRQFEAAAIKDRLDRVYLESLTAIEDGQTLPTMETSDSVQQDLDSLYDEVDDVVNLVVEHGHGAALKTNLQRLRHHQNDGNSASQELIHDQLIGLTSRALAASQSMEQVQLERLNIRDLDRRHQALSKADYSAHKEAANDPQATREFMGDAAAALLHHLGLHADSSQQTTLGYLLSKIDELVRAKEGQSASTLLESLIRLEAAADQRSSAIGMLSLAFSRTASSDNGLRSLEQQVAGLKVEVENAL